MKVVQIGLPYEKTPDVYNYLLDGLNIDNVYKIDVGEAHLLIFRVPDERVSDVVEALKSHGVGVDFGVVDILDTKISLPGDVRRDETDERIQREAVLAVEEIYVNVQRQASLSFDFIAFCILAALMAGVGLIQNNVTIIVASMLLSPLMGPMLGVALGYVIGDRSLFLKGTRNELIALALSFAVGAAMAAMMPFLYTGTPSLVQLVESQWSADPVVLTEITRRGGFSPLDVGVAVFSGAAVAVSVTRGDMSSLVGVAISAALMPPAVNVGMMLALGVLAGSPICIEIGIGSLMLLVMNIVVIDIAAIVMFRIKKLGMIADKSAKWVAVADVRRKGMDSLYHYDKASRRESTRRDKAPEDSPGAVYRDEDNG